MRQAVKLIRQLLEESTDQDRAQWEGQAQTILRAISTSHPTRRGVQTAIAAALFEKIILEEVGENRWTLVPSPSRRNSCIFTVANNGNTARILIATLQLESGKPRREQPATEQLYVARLPEKPGRRRSANNESRTPANSPQQESAARRSYSFDDFDLLAVSMQPVTHAWVDFRYALSRTLAPRRDQPVSIARTQTVPATQSHLWTTDLATCLGWHVETTSGTAAPKG